MENKNKCRELYNEYLIYKEKTHTSAHDIRKGKLKAYNVQPEDLLKRKELADKLYNECKDFFKDKPNELFDLEQDVSF